MSAITEPETLRTSPQDVVLRPITDDDGERLLRFHARLSLETTRLRFFSVHPRLSASELHRFTHVDHDDREAVVAVVDDEIIGVGRYDHIPGTGDVEVAFVVDDEWQGKGVGTRLLREVAARARARGYRRLVADTLPENRRMLSVFQHFAPVTTTSFRSGAVHVEIPLDQT
jgi:GNAT superfamily N-acetyltransferase